MFHVEPSGYARCEVPRETYDKLRLYETLLLRWNTRINLIGRREEANVWRRHFEDSLQLVALLPANSDRGVDLGTGAGFPGLVVAIASKVHFDLIEADRRKAAFLQEVIAATEAPATVHAKRIEAVCLGNADVLTARALAPLNKLLDYGSRFLKHDGTALFQKGARAQEEVADAKSYWQMNIVHHPSVTDSSSSILAITGLRRATG